jgi:hypothetical protein
MSFSGVNDLIFFSTAAEATDWLFMVVPKYSKTKDLGHHDMEFTSQTTPHQTSHNTPFFSRNPPRQLPVFRRSGTSPQPSSPRHLGCNFVLLLTFILLLLD